MGRDTVRIQSTPDTAAALESEDLLVIVDPMSTGATLAFEAAKLGLKICCVWSDVCPESLRHFVADGMAIDFVGEVHHRGDLKATCHALTQIGTVCNVIVGSEPGVECREKEVEPHEPWQLLVGPIAASVLTASAGLAHTSRR